MEVNPVERQRLLSQLTYFKRREKNIVIIVVICQSIIRGLFFGLFFGYGLQCLNQVLLCVYLLVSAISAIFDIIKSLVLGIYYLIHHRLPTVLMTDRIPYLELGITSLLTLYGMISLILTPRGGACWDLVLASVIFNSVGVIISILTYCLRNRQA